MSLPSGTRSHGNRAETKTNEGVTRLPTKLPFSLLGQLVYDRSSPRRPIARIHDTRAGIQKFNDDQATLCLASGHLRRVEFDLSPLPEVIKYVLHLYDRHSLLTEGLTSLSIPKDVLFFEYKPLKKPLDMELEPTANLLDPKTIFVGEILDIGKDGNCIRCVDAFTKTAFWNVIRSIGRVETPSFKGSLHQKDANLSITTVPIVGRIIIVEKLSPAILIAIHLALEYYFAVTAAVSLHIGDAKLGTNVLFDEMILAGRYRARHYSINFLYVVSSGEREKLTGWHKNNTSVLYEDDTGEHTPYIGRGTTAIQLCEKVKKEKAVSPHSMFKPWLILVLPAVPRPRFWRDHRYPVDVLIANASEAWLWVIYWEHLEVYSHMTQLFLMISELVSPPSTFMFDLKHIDQLLFDDEDFTKSKLYFWAYQSLETLQSTLMDIMDQWRQYSKKADIFRMDIKVPTEVEARHGAYVQRLDKILEKMDQVVGLYRKLSRDCKKKQTEIVALRDGLFNGSAVLESRNSSQLSAITVSQGENIKILTFVSIFFLPIAFVTSIFSMAVLPSSLTMKSFAIVLVCICIPAYGIIASLMNQTVWGNAIAILVITWINFIKWLHGEIPQGWKRPKHQVLGTLIKESIHTANLDNRSSASKTPTASKGKSSAPLTTFSVQPLNHEKPSTVVSGDQWPLSKSLADVRVEDAIPNTDPPRSTAEDNHATSTFGPAEIIRSSTSPVLDPGGDASQPKINPRDKATKEKSLDTPEETAPNVASQSHSVSGTLSLNPSQLWSRWRKSWDKHDLEKANQST